MAKLPWDTRLSELGQLGKVVFYGRFTHPNDCSNSLRMRHYRTNTLFAFISAYGGPLLQKLLLMRRFEDQDWLAHGTRVSVVSRHLQIERWQYSSAVPQPIAAHNCLTSYQ